MPQDDRKDFKKYQVDIVYELQDGSCYNCGGALAKGMHRHHKDGKHENNETGNLQLMCAECHRATYADAYKAHKVQEKLVLQNLNEMVHKGFAKELSGAHMERLLDALSQSLKVSRSINNLDKGIEYPSKNIALSMRYTEQQVVGDAYLHGLIEGMKRARTSVDLHDAQEISKSAYDLNQLQKIMETALKLKSDLDDEVGQH